jgi:SAM-dependent methyltransferase
LNENGGSGLVVDGKYPMKISSLIGDEDSLRKELVVHGQRWAGIFDGYFSDPEAARLLVEAVERAIDAIRPAVAADLGGGTGFVLAELLRRGLKGVRLVNVEISEKQLAACKDRQIVPLRASLDRVVRRHLMGEDERLLLMARSVLHYFGDVGLDPLLQHLRGQLRLGELFVHQSACYQRQKDADLMNHLYRRMKTGKWFFTEDKLKGRLEHAGFLVREVIPAPRLEMRSLDLGERYGLSPAQRAFLGREIGRLYDPSPEIFVSSEDGFIAWLHFCIFTCEAV